MAQLLKLLTNFCGWNSKPKPSSKLYTSQTFYPASLSRGSSEGDSQITFRTTGFYCKNLIPTLFWARKNWNAIQALCVMLHTHTMM